MILKHHITLIGMPGVGKTTIGKALAKKISFKFLDTDHIVLDQNHLALQDIIITFGDHHLLDLEETVILSLAPITPTLIATGGSVVYSAKAMSHLKELSVIVYLKDSFENIERRIHNLDTRGIVGLKEKGLKGLFEEREKLYKQYADVTLPVTRLRQLELTEALITATKGLIHEPC